MGCWAPAKNLWPENYNQGAVVFELHFVNKPFRQLGTHSDTYLAMIILQLLSLMIDPDTHFHLNVIILKIKLL